MNTSSIFNTWDKLGIFFASYLLSIIESVSKEEYERLIKGVDNNVQIVLNWRVEELIKTVSSEITDYAKKANYWGNERK